MGGAAGTTARESAADPGASVTLTIDRNDSVHRRKGTGRAIEETHAKAGTVVVQDPNSGRTAGGRELADVRSQRCRTTFRTKRAWIAPWRRVRAGLDVQGDYADRRDRKWRGDSRRTWSIARWARSWWRAVDSRLASLRRAERARSSGAFERRGRDQGCAAAGRAEFLRHDTRVRHRPAHGNRVAGRKSRPAAAARKLDGEFDRLARDGAGSERHADSDHLRDFGDREWRHALSAAHRARKCAASAGALRAAPSRSK